MFEGVLDSNRIVPRKPNRPSERVGNHGYDSATIGLKKRLPRMDVSLALVLHVICNAIEHSVGPVTPRLETDQREFAKIGVTRSKRIGTKIRETSDNGIPVAHLKTSVASHAMCSGELIKANQLSTQAFSVKIDNRPPRNRQLSRIVVVIVDWSSAKIQGPASRKIDCFESEIAMIQRKFQQIV
jgi:hypothetical protein